MVRTLLRRIHSILFIDKWWFMSKFEKYSLLLQLFGFVLIIISIFYTAQTLTKQIQDSEITVKERSLDYVNATLDSLDALYVGFIGTKINELSANELPPADSASYPVVSEKCYKILNKLEIIHYTIKMNIYDKEILDNTLMKDLRGYNPYLTRCITHFAQPYKTDYPLLIEFEHNKANKRKST